MQKKTKYHSRNRDRLLRVINNSKKSFSAKELQATIRQKGEHISSSTLYRLLEDFTSTGIIAKDISENGTASYRRVESCTSDNHCYLQCSKCHKTIHTDCIKIAKLAEHLNKKHDFTVNNSSLIIYGTCGDCQ